MEAINNDEIECVCANDAKIIERLRHAFAALAMTAATDQ